MITKKKMAGLRIYPQYDNKVPYYGMQCHKKSDFLEIKSDFNTGIHDKRVKSLEIWNGSPLGVNLFCPFRGSHNSSAPLGAHINKPPALRVVFNLFQILGRNST